MIVNGRSCSWGNIIAKIDGVEHNDFLEISYDDGLDEGELGYAMGLSHAPTRRSRGKYAPSEGKLVGYAGSMQLLLEQIAAKAGGNISGAEFLVTVNFAYMDSEPTRTHTLHACRILHIEDSFSEGPDLIKESVTLKPRYIERATSGRPGLKMFDGVPGL